MSANLINPKTRKIHLSYEVPLFMQATHKQGTTILSSNRIKIGMSLTIKLLTR
jgi:hypothetical protein